MEEIITACVLFIISMGAFVISIRSFNEKGFLFNNAYLYASKQERQIMPKKQYYRQSAIIFLLVGSIFLINTIEVITHMEWLFSIVAILIIITIVYTIVSSIIIGRRK